MLLVYPIFVYVEFLWFKGVVASRTNGGFFIIATTWSSCSSLERKYTFNNHCNPPFFINSIISCREKQEETASNKRKIHICCHIPKFAGFAGSAGILSIYKRKVQTIFAGCCGKRGKKGAGVIPHPLLLSFLQLHISLCVWKNYRYI